MQLKANNITIEYDIHGPDDGEPLLLIMGLGMQMVAWHNDFVAMLVARGFRVIRFDNRDIGLSQDMAHLGRPKFLTNVFRHTFGLKIKVPYTLGDMADDAADLLEALGIPCAHVCGASMGGMIAQHLAIRHPQRVKSLTLMMTSSGAAHLPKPSAKVKMALLARPADSSFESIAEHFVNLYQLIGSPHFPTAKEVMHDYLQVFIHRSYRPDGAARQFFAILADGDRSHLLSRIKAPTLILHGEHDVLIPVASGYDLHAKILNSKLVVIPGWGHDLPFDLWPQFVEQISDHAVHLR